SPSGEDHYLVSALPVLGLVVGIVCEHLPIGASTATRVRTVYGLMLAMLLFGSVWHDRYWNRIHARSQIPSPPADVVIGERIATATRPGDTLFVDGPQGIYAHAGARPFSRFIYDAPNDPHATAAREEGLRQRPSFVFLRRHTYDRIRSGMLL